MKIVMKPVCILIEMISSDSTSCHLFSPYSEQMGAAESKEAVTKAEPPQPQPRPRGFCTLFGDSDDEKPSANTPVPKVLANLFTYAFFLCYYLNFRTSIFSCYSLMLTPMLNPIMVRSKRIYEEDKSTSQISVLINGRGIHD